MRIFAAILLAMFAAAPAIADQVSTIRRPDGSVSIVQTKGRDTEVINSTGQLSYHVSDRSHESVVRSLAPHGSQVVKMPRN
jgi:hypothetical protein